MDNINVVDHLQKSLLFLFVIGFLSLSFYCFGLAYIDKETHKKLDEIISNQRIFLDLIPETRPLPFTLETQTLELPMIEESF